MVALVVRTMVLLEHSPWHSLTNLRDEKVRLLPRSVGDLPSGQDQELTASLNSPLPFLHVSLMTCCFAVVPFCQCPSPIGLQTRSTGIAVMLREDPTDLTLTSNCEIKD